MLLTRKLTFSASHRYENPNWNVAKNRAVFGPCYSPHGHGHNYEIEVSLRGPIDPETGMILNLRTVDEVLQREIFDRFDHRNINVEVPECEGIIPTLENLCLVMWDMLQPPLREAGGALHRIRLHESRDLYCDYFGPNGS